MGGVFIALIAGLIFGACDVGDNKDLTKKPQSFIAAPDIGYTISTNAGDTTDTLTFMFEKPVNLLKRDITILNGDDGEARKSVSDDAFNAGDIDGKVWLLKIVVSAAGDIKIKISHAGVAGEYKTVPVLKEGSIAPITYTVTADGEDNTTTSETLTLNFSASVSGIAADNITVANGINGRAEKSEAGLEEIGEGDGRTWTLGIMVTVPGDINVSVAYTINGTPVTTVIKNIPVYVEGAPSPITYTITADGTAGDSTSAELVFEFSEPVNNIPFSNIDLVDSGEAHVTLKAATFRQNSANRAIWILGLDVDAPGTLTIKIDEFANVETSEKQVPVVVGNIEWPPAPSTPGLYQYKYSNRSQKLINIGALSLGSALGWIADNAWAAGAYRIVTTGGGTTNEPGWLFNSAAVNGKSGVSINFINTGGELTINLSQNGSMCDVSHPMTISMTGLRLVGKANNTAPLVYLHARGAVFIMESGAIQNNENVSSTASVYGGGVYVYNEGTFIMNGGTISGNKAVYNGSSSSYYTAGGGVCLNASIFNMNGGTISGNTSLNTAGSGSSFGGGVSIVTAASHFTMKTGAVISGNICNAQSYTRGAGVHIWAANSTFIMDGGTIQDNEFTGGNYAYGAGVNVQAGASFLMKTGALITGNVCRGTSQAYGGGLALQKGEAAMESGAVISNNETLGQSLSRGGGVMTMNAGTRFYMNDGAVISGNSAKATASGAQGGGISVDSNSIVTMRGGTISANKASSDGANTRGGGVALSAANAAFSKAGGIIYGNEEGAGALANKVTMADENTPREDLGHAIWCAADKLWGSTVDAGRNLSSGTAGGAGGWFVEE